MSDDKPRRSRTAWPGPMSIAGVDPGHEHRLPDALVRRVLLQTRAIVIFGVCLVVIGASLLLIVLGRGQARDEENERTNQRINDAICDLLDQLPEGGLLDRPRHKYGCGPGIPLNELTPEEQAQLTNRTPAPVAPSPAPSTPSPFVAPPLGAGAVPTVPEDRTPPPPPRPTTPPGPATPPPPPPVVDLGPITDAVCGALRVCL